jgi:PhoPQ-activated pathogenicity-related protein
MINLFIEELLDLTHLDYIETGLIDGVYVKHSCNYSVFWTPLEIVDSDNYCHHCKVYISWRDIDLKATRRHISSVSYRKLTER